MFIIKFSDQTILSKPSPTPYGNYYDDHASQWDRGIALKFKSRILAEIVALIVGGKVVDNTKIYRYEIGKYYLTNDGSVFFVDKCKNKTKGYETVCNEEGSHRYNRTTFGGDNGRTTGSKYTGKCLRYPPEEVDIDSGVHGSLNI